MKRLILLSFFGALVWGATAAATDYVVVKTLDADTYNLGDIIDGATPLKLGDGSELTLINSSGRKIVVKGPRTQPLEQKAAASSKDSGGEPAPSGRPIGLKFKVNVVQSLARLFKEQVVDTGSLGGFRSVGAARMRSDPWMVDVSQGGHFCFSQDKSVSLWRPETKTAGSVRLRETASKQEASAAWPSNTSSVEWPVELPVTDGKSYLLQADGVTGTKTLTLHKVPKQLPTRVHQAAWMAEQKCDQQAVLLVVSSDVESMVDSLIKGGKF